MEINAKEHLNVDFLRSNLSKFSTIVITLIKDPKSFYAGRFQSLEREVMISVEIYFYILTLLSACISLIKYQSLSNALTFIIGNVVFIKFGPTVVKLICEKFEADMKELEIYRDFLRLYGTISMSLYLIVSIFPMFSVKLGAFLFGLYLTYYTLYFFYKNFLKVNKTGIRVIYIGFTFFVVQILILISILNAVTTVTSALNS